MPLISLIEDNLRFVQDLGIPSCSLSGSKGKSEDRKFGWLYDEIKAKKYKIVYLTPEKIAKSPGLMASIDEMYNQGTVDRFVIDEVHCMSEWG